MRIDLFDGRGIPFFSPRERLVHLEVAGTRIFSSRAVRLRYRRDRGSSQPSGQRGWVGAKSVNRGS